MDLKRLAPMMLICLSACSWFGHKAAAPPVSTQIVVSGAPAESLLLLDGIQSGQPAGGGRPLVVQVVPGDHRVEIQVGERVVYREDTYVAAGEHQRITVLSGPSH